jgi:hypothetical protein
MYYVLRRIVRQAMIISDSECVFLLLWCWVYRWFQSQVGVWISFLTSCQFVTTISITDHGCSTTAPQQRKSMQIWRWPVWRNLHNIHHPYTIVCVGRSRRGEVIRESSTATGKVLGKRPCKDTSESCLSKRQQTISRYRAYSHPILLKSDPPLYLKLWNAAVW